jgi:EmrB/QacA subfamily drug resistance transporter
MPATDGRPSLGSTDSAIGDRTSPGVRRRPWLVFIAVLPGIFLTLADATIMSVAIPRIIRELDASVTGVSWVMNGYNLVLTVLFLPMGRFADRFGHRRLFVAGLALFTAASLGCALSGSLEALVVWRVVQAVGAAAVVPTALTLLMAGFPAGRQGFAAGLFGMASTLAAALGPTLGGLLIERWSWPAIFWFNLPVGAAGIALGAALLPRLGAAEPAPQAQAPGAAGADAAAPGRRPLDLPGLAISSLALFCLTLALIQANDWGWTSAATLGLFSGAGVGLVLFVLREFSTDEPVFDLRLFRDRTFASASAAIMTVDVAMMGCMFMLVIYMESAMDYTTLRAALVVTAVPAAALVLSPISGRIVDWVGPRLPAMAGAVLSAAGLYLLGRLSRTAPTDAVVWRTALVGIGLGLSLPAFTAAGMSAVPAGARGVGSGMLNTARQLGFLLGVALLVAIFAHTMSEAVNAAADEGQALARAAALSPAVERTLTDALDSARTIDATAGFSEIRRIANPVADALEGMISGFEGVQLLALSERIENLFWDEVAAAFRWPFTVAALAALVAVVPGALLRRR